MRLGLLDQELFPPQEDAIECVYRGYPVPPLLIENAPSWLQVESGGGLGFAAPVFLWAAQLLLPAALASGAIVGGGLLLKDALGINPDMIPYSAVAAGLGASLFAVGWRTEKTVSTVFTVGGFLLTAGSLALLFIRPGAPGLELTPSPKVDPAERVPVPVGDRIELNVDPAQPNTGGYYRQVGLPQAFEVQVTNRSNQTLAFFVGVSVYRYGEFLYQTPFAPSAKQECGAFAPSNFGRQKVTLAPGQPQVVCVAVPAATNLLFAAVNVQFQLYRDGEDAVSFLLTSPEALEIGWGLG